MTDLTTRLEALRDGDPLRAYVVCTGAGAGLQQMLWDLPGASRFLAGAAFPYAREDVTACLGFGLERACDADAAIELAMAAYARAWTPHIDHAVGVGLTAVVATDRVHRGAHRVFVAAMSRRGCTLRSAMLPSGVGAEARAAEGRLCDLLGLSALLEAAGRAGIDTPGIEIETVDASARARELLLARPFFAADGLRHAAPAHGVHFPGTFDPPHHGHFDIADRLARIGRRVLFTITVDPPHKAPVDVCAMLERATMLRGRDVLFTEGDALYLDKARRWRCDMALGTDAIARMLDMQWGVPAAELLGELDGLGVRLFVAERELDGVWLGLDALAIPPAYRHLFCSLGRCVSGSSSAIRAELAMQ